MQRSVKGQALVEMVIAVGLSGFFVLLLSGMLSQTLVLSNSSQNEIIATNAAELLIENARSISYANYQMLSASGAIALSVPVQLPINLTGVGDITPPAFRQPPVQLDLTDQTKTFGMVDPTSGTIVASRVWSSAAGNYFRGNATETVSPVLLSGLSAYKIDVVVSYTPGNSSTGMKQVKRTAYVLANGVVY